MTETDESPLRHGGDIDVAAERYGIAVADWLDLSTGINPNPYPIPDIPDRAWARLPEISAEARLIDAARACYGAERAAIVAAPGTQALIQILPQLRPASRVHILGPTYAEHAAAWRRAGHEVSEITIGGPWPGDADVIVAVHPNNPDGHHHAAEHIRDACQRLAAKGGWLVLDEAFADVVPARSMAGEAGRDGLIVLRSFGKFFGLAGLRLGFALTDVALADRLRDRLGPWCVPGPALEIGCQALSDTAWIKRTRETLAEARRRLDESLGKAGAVVIGGTDLFVLIRDARGGLHERLAEQGIWTRVFDGRSGLVRLGLPGDGAAFHRLSAALA